MKNRRKFLGVPLILMGALLLFASSCEKDNNAEDGPNTFTDPRDGNVYKTITIGNQVWMAENLKYLPGVVDASTGSRTIAFYYVYGYDGSVVADAKATDSYITYGVLYNWEAAKAACPEGWHLPSDAEWMALIDTLGGASVAGGKLKESDTTHWTSPNTDATNESGFTALPGGIRHAGGPITGIGTHSFFWSSTEGIENCAWYHLMYYKDGIISTNDNGDLQLGLSVRCVKDDL